MHVVLLSQYFPPEIGAPQHRLGYLARRLRQKNHEVTVVTALPNYPTGRVFQGWRGRFATREQTEFGTVLRSWLYATQKRDTVRQLLNYGSFAGLATVMAPFRIRKADVVLWESPPLFLAPAAWLLARRLHGKMVMNVSDLWPRSAVDLGLLDADGLLAQAFEQLERAAYRRAHLVTCQTEGIAEGIRARCPSARTYLFPNGVDLATFHPRPAGAHVRAHLGAVGSTTLVGYLGNFGRAQALEQVIDAARVLAAEAPDVRFVLLGDGPRRAAIELLARSAALPNLAIFDPVAHAAVPDVLAALDVALVTLADRPVFEGARPSKLFEILAMGLPVIYAGRGEGARLATESGAAIVVPPEQPDELARAVGGLAGLSIAARRQLGERGRAFVAASFDRAKLSDDMISVIEALG